jgi:predicted dehydrogenase
MPASPARPVSPRSPSRSARRRSFRPSRPSGRGAAGPIRIASRKVRFAVVGLGYFAQVAVLPAFKRAKGVELVALVSDDATKLRQLGQEYDVPLLATYDSYDDLLASGGVDAVYICLPNDLHEEFTVRAARQGVHVLCEKPLAVTSAECRRMMDACRRAGVRLMTAYRLHFNGANLEAVRAIADGDIGKPRYFTSSFSMQVKPGIRTRGEDRGGGPLYDIGIYCINAARYLFREEPAWVQAVATTGQRQARFKAIDEQVTCILGFTQGKTATFTVSYGAADVATYTVVGTKGIVCLDDAYEHSTPMTLEVEVDGKARTRRFAKRDQVAPELTHFAACLRADTDPEPSGKEGLIDVAIIEAIRRAARTGRRIPVRVPARGRRPSPRQAMRVRGHRRPDLVNAKVPFQK